MDILKGFIKEANTKNFPYQIVLCADCELIIIGDCENWPPRGMNSCTACDKTWCRECSKKVQMQQCAECFSCHCLTCSHFK